MGVSIEQWRCRIGTFEQPVKCKVALPTLRLKYVSLSIRVMLFFMLLSQGIEANPGPPPTSSVTYDRGGRGGGRGRGAGPGAGRGSGRGARGGGNELYRSQSQGPGRVTRSSSQKQNRQPSINAWLNNASLEARSDSRNSRRNNINLGAPGPNARIHTNTNAWLGNRLSSAMSWEESESKVRDYIYEELEIDQRQIRIERAHRLGSKTTPKAHYS